MPGYHLAQLNIGRVLAPPDDPRLAEFMAQLDAVNAIADTTPGFVWRLKTEAGNATGIHAYDDPLLLINMSVWESPEHLKQYVYAGPHLDVMRRRADRSSIPSPSHRARACARSRVCFARERASILRGFPRAP